MHAVLYDAAGHRRSPVTMPRFHEGRAPRNKGRRYPADPPTVEEIVAVMRCRRHHRRRSVAGADRDSVARRPAAGWVAATSALGSERKRSLDRAARRGRHPSRRASKAGCPRCQFERPTIRSEGARARPRPFRCGQVAFYSLRVAISGIGPLVSIPCTSATDTMNHRSNSSSDDAAFAKKLSAPGPSVVTSTRKPPSGVGCRYARCSVNPSWDVKRTANLGFDLRGILDDLWGQRATPPQARTSELSPRRASARLRVTANGRTRRRVNAGSL